MEKKMNKQCHCISLPLWLPRKQSAMPDLPQEIIEEILSRLPVESLLKCKCVSKKWRSLISDPQFHDLHLQQARKNGRPKNLIKYHVCSGFHLIEKPEFNQLYFIDADIINCDNDSDSVKPVRLHLPPLNVHDDDVMMEDIVGSCDGLLWMVIVNYTKGHMDLILWNPLTREYRELPRISPDQENIIVSLHPRPKVYVYGFGYDPSTDDYKLIRGEPPQSPAASCGGKGDVKLLSLDTNSWRSIGSFEYQVTQERIGVIVNGAIHWILLRAQVDDSTPNCVIVALDLETEKFREISMPHYGANDYNGYALKVLGGCLCVVNHTHQMGTLEVWKMTHCDSMGYCWTKITSISHLPQPNLFTLCFTKSGQALLSSPKEGLVRCNLQKNVCKKLKFRINLDEQIFSLSLSGSSLTYIESFLSPNRACIERKVIRSPRPTACVRLPGGEKEKPFCSESVCILFCISIIIFFLKLAAAALQ